MSAQMTTEPSGDGGMAMERERNTTIGAVADLPAIAAKQRCRKATPVEEQDGLFAFLQTFRNRL
jgi:hypothetical protein